MTLEHVADTAIDEAVRRHIDKLFDVYFSATDDAAVDRLINGIKLSVAKYDTAIAALEAEEL